MLGQALRVRRAQVGLSNQSKLAHLLGAHARTVAGWERGGWPRLDMLVRIAKFLQVDEGVVVRLVLDDLDEEDHGVLDEVLGQGWNGRRA